MDGRLATASAALDDFAARPAYVLSDGELAAATVDVQRLISRATSALTSLIREAEARDMPRRHGALSTTTWLRDLLRIAPRDGRQLVALARVADLRPVLADALASGAVNPGQASAIARVLDDVPTDEPALRDKVEASLVELAGQFEPAILHSLGERVLAHLDPDLADRRLLERLDREQRHARQRRGFTLSADGLGGVRLSGVLDAEGAATVAAAIDPLAAPVKGDDGPDLRTPAARRADALVEACRLALASGGLPPTGGIPPHLTVTVDWEGLRRGVGIGELDTGGHLAPATVRRLACEAQILPAVLGTAGVPIDLGRARRLFTGSARQAVLLRDHGCAFPGCDRPERWTVVHHIKHWIDGGTTDLDNAVALCGHHHRVVHAGAWTVRLGADRRPEFIPPRTVDAEQRPRRNPYHQRR